MITTLVVEVANPVTPEVTEPLEFAVDSGTVHPVVPGDILRRLGIRPLKQETLRLANGMTIVRHKGAAIFKFQDRIGGADVIFGEEGDATLLGTLSLGALGLSLDPIKRELRPMQLTL